MGYRAICGVAVVALASWGCVNNLEPPASAFIECSSNAECPEGWECRTSIGRCQARGAEDQPPGIVMGSVTIVPAEATFEVPVEIAFDADESLAMPPVVRVGGLAATLIASEDPHYSFVYRVGAGATEGTASVTADLVDLAGNAADGVTVGTVELDFTDPGLAGAPTVSNSVLGASGDTTISFLVTEPLGEPPRVSVRTATTEAEAIREDSGGVAQSYVYRYTASGTEPHGPAVLVIGLLDIAGNRGDVEVGGLLEVDVEPPALISGGSTVVLYPGSANPLTEVSTVTVGTTVRVTFGVSEPLAVDPVVTATCSEQPACSGVSLPFSMVSQAGSYYTYELTVAAAGNPDTTYSIDVEVEDVGGNVGAGNAGTFELDTTIPSLPDVDSPRRIVFERAPWGRDGTGGLKSFRLVGSPAAVDAGSTVLVYESAAVATAVEVGRGLALEDGSFDVALSGGDLQRVYVTAVDGAGNRSDDDSAMALPVRDIDWIATLSGKVPGSRFPNPHRVELRPHFTEQVVGDLVGSRLTVLGAAEASGSQLGEVGGAPASVAGGASWMRVGTPEAPPRGASTAAFDSGRGEMLLFHGKEGITWLLGGGGWRTLDAVDPDGDGNPPGFWLGASLDDGGHLLYDARRDVTTFVRSPASGTGSVHTWELSGNSWRMAATTGPPAGDGLAAAIDTARGVVVAFGAITDQCTGWYCGDTWEWDGSEWVPVASGGPAPRGWAAMTYDSTRQRVILFGGEDASGNVLSDQWEWDGDGWTERCIDDESCTGTPGSRMKFAMTYDPFRERVVLFSGHESPGCPGDQYCGDIWEWNESTLTWLEMTPTDPEKDGDPDGRIVASLSYSPLHGMAVLSGGENEFAAGGCDGNPGPEPDMCLATWGWDGTSWRRIHDPVGAGTPSPRSGHVMAFDEERQRAVVVGGTGVTPQPAGTWEWMGFQWVQTSASSPGTIRAPGFAYDRLGKRTILVNGLPAVGVHDHQETLAYSGSTWSVVSTSGPSPRYQVASAYDPCNDRVVIFGGFQQVASQGACGDGATADSGGRCYLSDTWTLTGSTWNSPAVGNPPGRANAALAFDPDSCEGVLFGGGNTSAMGDTWVLSDGSWSPSSASGPVPRRGALMLYDARRGRILLWGGQVEQDACSTGDACADLWEWDGSDWVPQDVIDAEGDGSPEPRINSTWSYDTGRQRPVLFGGRASGVLLDDTWLLDSGVGSRPGQVLTVAFAEAGLVGGETITEVAARWVAGATGYDGDVATGGASLAVWDLGTWNLVATSASATRSNLESLSWCVHDPAYPSTESGCNPDAARARRLPIGADSRLGFAVLPVHPNGLERAEVVSDYVEIRVGYRL